MKFIEERKIMKIDITRNDGVIKLKVDEETRTFDFDALDCLIEKIVTTSENINVTAEDGLDNYKVLINELVKEVRNDEFKQALAEVKENDIKEKN